MNNEASSSVDLARFEELSDGDRASLRELIQLYLVKTGEQMKELDQAIASGASANVARIAHSLVGANAMVGIDSVIPSLRTLESHGEHGELAQARAVFGDLHQRFQAIHAHLQKTADSLSET